MVKGLDHFKKHFQKLADQYVLIGGVACYLAMTAAGLDFRATKDLDIVLCAEALDKKFVAALWDFIRDGDYQIQEKVTGEKQFYRFNKPSRPGFPVMLELFSRAPDVLSSKEDQHLSPIPVEEEVASLSAILLDGDYYNWILQGRQVLSGVPVVTPEHLIPLKARAWLDLKERKETGANVSSKDIKKHRNDVFRLFAVISPETMSNVPGPIKADLRTFIAGMEGETIDMQAMGLRSITKVDVLANLKVIYVL